MLHHFSKPEQRPGRGVACQTDYLYQWIINLRVKEDPSIAAI